jgi:transposase
MGSSLWTPRSSSAPIPSAIRGYHGGKKITGRGQHLAVDCAGWLLALVVTAASVSDKAGAKLLVIKLFDAFTTLQIMWADAGYDGAPLARWAKTIAAITVEVVKRTSPHSFQVVRRRWVIERTFGWLMRYRRLARDYERRTGNHEAMVYRATVSACVSNTISIDTRRGYAGTSTVARRSQSSPSLGPMDPDVVGATVAPRKSSRSDSGTQIISAGPI